MSTVGASANSSEWRVSGRGNRRNPRRDRSNNNSPVHSRKASMDFHRESKPAEQIDTSSVKSSDPNAGKILAKDSWVRDPIHFLLASMALIAADEVRKANKGKDVRFYPGEYEIDFYAKSVEESRNPYKLWEVGDVWQYGKKAKRNGGDLVKVGNGKTLESLLAERIIEDFKFNYIEDHPGEKFSLFAAVKEYGNPLIHEIVFAKPSRYEFNTAVAKAKSFKERDVTPTDTNSLTYLIFKYCGDKLDEIYYEPEYILNWVEFKNIHNPILYIHYSVDGVDKRYARRFVTPNYAEDAAYSLPKYWPPKEYRVVYSGDEASGHECN